MSFETSHQQESHDAYKKNQRCQNAECSCVTAIEYYNLPLGTIIYVVDPIPMGPRSFVGTRRGVKGMTISSNYPPRCRVDDKMFVIYPDASHIFINAESAQRAAVTSVDTYVAKKLQIHAKRSTRTALAAIPQIERNATQMRERCHEIKDLENVI